MRDVLIVGAGAVGLALAARLLDAGLDVVLWERRPAPTGLSRAIGIHAPALDVLAEAGVAQQVVDEAVLVRRGIARTRDRVLGVVPFDGVSPRFPFVATLPQARTEEILHARVEALSPGSVQRGATLLSLVEESDGVRVTGVVDEPGAAVAGGAPRTGTGAGTPPSVVEETARFVVAADGSRSTVRDLLGITAPVRSYPDTYVMADLLDTTGAGPDAVIHLERDGVVESFPLPGGLRRWVVRTDARVVGPTPEQLAAVVEHRTGVPVDPSTCSMISSFAVRRRLADRTVQGRTILLGDAAHEISPIGGQGMNLGWLDAGRLAQVLIPAARTGAVPSEALARFDAARRRRARWAARQAEANMALGRPTSGTAASVRDVLLTGALRGPARGALASVYAMRMLR
ncbi:FAD-dependent oxidoreductase [Sanguibacter inulinus]|uniref:FAD-dependent monooxygenase n=1 Tax=Sanguibacter inulinus TaxID=60922 RepID=A0A853F1Y0_9MICO|nr:NAD(P)/FAD-dependent oxidoreductase [Sanguibacter inulinus]MBF0723903.1 FAD-dependent monooxygenase [Sanguibacter inulinus]NYS95048.1 FAD-dependent monooxygenase [Sanguibacter inulinus]